MRTRKQQIADLNRTVARAVRGFAPPEDITVDVWADRHRRLSSASSAEAGPWRTERTPYLREPMRAVTDPDVRKIVMVAASQVGKTEFELNALGYIIDQDPGGVLYVHPTLNDARDFSVRRIAPMLKDSPALSGKVRDVKAGRGESSTVLRRTFPGGILILAGSNVASSLASNPMRYIIGDELDRWAPSAGDEGDPWKLAEARTTTFFNAKLLAVSTPTVKGASKIDEMYREGTCERWCHRCPECGAWHEVRFDDIRFKPRRSEAAGDAVWDVEGPMEWACPSCGCVTAEAAMRRQPARWIAERPEALASSRCRSFWLNAFSSPWVSWRDIAVEFLNAKDNPKLLKVVYNTKLGQLWEDRGDLETEDEMMARREDYGTRPDGSPVELPDGVLVVTVGVDTQDDRLEYEVVGHGRWGETWGVEKGIIMGDPADPAVWERLDGVTQRAYLYEDGTGLRPSLTCVDSGGHRTQQVYERCRERWPKRVVAIKGKGGESVPFTGVPTKVSIRDKSVWTWLYTVGVDAGKETIMSSLKAREPGPRFCHFPLRREAGYDMAFFSGLLSERLVRRANGGLGWEKLPGHKRNEALDCRNYSLAALDILNPDWDRLEKARKAPKDATAAPSAKRRRKRRQKREGIGYDDW